MGTRRFDTTFSFVQARADAIIRCPKCRRTVKVSGNEFRLMFDMPLPINDAKKRLRCSSCSHRGAEVAPVPEVTR